jgi:hypothetical protein
MYGFAHVIINDLRNKLLAGLQTYNPKHCVQFNDTRIHTYYISINRTTYLVLYGVSDDCDRVVLCNNDAIKEDITTDKGLDLYANTNERFKLEEDNYIILDINLAVFLEELYLSIDDLLLIIKSRL